MGRKLKYYTTVKFNNKDYPVFMNDSGLIYAKLADIKKLIEYPGDISYLVSQGERRFNKEFNMVIDRIGGANFTRIAKAIPVQNVMLFNFSETDTVLLREFYEQVNNDVNLVDEKISEGIYDEFDKEKHLPEEDLSISSSKKKGAKQTSVSDVDEKNIEDLSNKVTEIYDFLQEEMETIEGTLRHNEEKITMLETTLAHNTEVIGRMTKTIQDLSESIEHSAQQKQDLTLQDVKKVLDELNISFRKV